MSASSTSAQARGPAAVPDRPGTARVGCSGWSYKDWGDAVYRGLPAGRWLACYANLFSTVELNNTFYRLPSPDTFDGWREQAPAKFVFAVKMHRYGTHRRRLREPQAWLGNQLQRVVRLGRATGPQLVQLPPRWKADRARLSEFCAAAIEAERAARAVWAKESGSPKARPLRWAVEFRDPSWLDDAIFAVLADYGFALCVHDMIERHPWELTTSWAYVRFHGPQGPQAKYAGEYGPELLTEPATRLARWLDQGHDIYAYFNNDRGGAAVRDATWLDKRLVS